MMHGEFGDIRRPGRDGSRSPSGDVIVYREIIRGTGRPTPKRMTLRDAATTELLDVDARRGARGHMPGVAESREVYALRSMLEPRAMAELAALPEADRIATCTVAGNLIDRMNAESDAAAWHRLSRDFHECLAHPLRTTRPLLWRLLQALLDRPTLPMAVAAHANRDYRDLVAAIRDGDTDRASRVMADYISGTTQSALKFRPEAN
jgi:DNA-binding GntR family transcriptional regulator